MLDDWVAIAEPALYARTGKVGGWSTEVPSLPSQVNSPFQAYLSYLLAVLDARDRPLYSGGWMLCTTLTSGVRRALMFPVGAR